MSVVNSMSGQIDFAKTREYKRYPQNLPSILIINGKKHSSTIRDISEGGGQIVCEEDVDAQMGSSVRLRLSFAGGAEIEIQGTVRWSHEENIKGAFYYYGLQFYALGQTEKEVIENHLRQCEEGAKTLSRSHGTTLSSYDLQGSNEGCIWLEVRGPMAPKSAAEVSIKIRGWVEQLRGNQVVMIFDASQYAPSREEGLLSLFESFKECGKKVFMGALVGDSSTGLLQIRRLLRDEELGDSFATFITVQEAQDFFMATEEFGLAWRRFKRVAIK